MTYAIRRADHGLIVPEEYLKAKLAPRFDYYIGTTNTLSFLFSGLIIDWLIAGYGADELMETINPDMRAPVTKWLSKLSSRIDNAEEFDDINVRFWTLGAEHKEYKTFSLFKLKCQIVKNQGGLRQWATFQQDTIYTDI